MDYIFQLDKLGYSQYFDDSRARLGASIEQVARVIAEHKGAYMVANATGEYLATVTGKRMLAAVSRDDYPAVGDWVIVNNETGDTKIIIDILPRKTALHKKYGGKDEAQLIAANVDVAFIVESVDRDYSLNRFERYLVLAREAGIKPVIVLNKADLLAKDELDTKINQIRERFGGVDALATSATTNTGLDALVGYIEKGLTYCFLGSSGVGKSSLINKLLDTEHIATNEVGEKTGRGKHTTTSRELYVTAGGGIIIDNPGSREVGVLDSSNGIKDVFVDIESIAKTCKFKDCKHQNEPGCEVIVALKNSTINASQYENYLKLQKETEHFELSTYGKRQKDKKFGKFIKSAKKDLKNTIP